MYKRVCNWCGKVIVNGSPTVELDLKEVSINEGIGDAAVEFHPQCWDEICEARGYEAKRKNAEPEHNEGYD